MSQVDALRICFVLPDDSTEEENYSSEMRLASQLVIKYGGDIEWIKPSDCSVIVPQKKDVFVFDKFEGNAFEFLKKNSSKYVYVFIKLFIYLLRMFMSFLPKVYCYEFINVIICLKINQKL